jgi:ADP-heptose:LPS heptosyltransferase
MSAVATLAGRRVVAAAAGAQSWAARLIGTGVFGISGRGLPAATIDPAQLRSVVVVRPDELGDLVMTSPFLRELRRALPEARITLVVKPELAELVAACPYVDAILTYPVSAPKWQRPFVLPLRAMRMARRLLRPLEPDLVVLPRWDGDQCYATFLAYWSGARWVVGHSEGVTDYKRTINRGFDRLLTHPIGDRTVRHEVERSLEPLAVLGRTPVEDRLELWTVPSDRVFADRLLADAGVQPDDRLVALSPGAGHSVLKQWPLEHFVELATRLAEAPDTRLVLVGAGADVPLTRQIAAAVGDRAIDTAGRTTIGQAAALLERSALCISNDTGPMHVAAAAGVPVVALFGASNYRRFGPWKGHRVLTLDLPCSPAMGVASIDRCRSCLFDRPRCMHELSVDSVAQVASAALRMAPGYDKPPALR